MSTKVPKRRRTLLYIIGGVLLLLVIAAIVKARQKPKGEEVTVEEVQRRTISETVSASGKIFPETEVKITSDVSGEVVELYVREGDSVTVGQILAKIRPDEYQSAVERGQAAVSSARAQKQISSANVKGSSATIDQLKANRDQIGAQRDAAKSLHERNKQLLKEGVISQQEFENSQSNYLALESSYKAAVASLASAETNLASARENVRVAEYGINSANATLKELRTSLQKTIIIAPVSGIISKLSIEKGERVVGTLQFDGTEMMRIANLHSMEVQVEVSENDILKVSVDDKTDIEVDAYLGRKFKGKVTEIANSASNVTAAAGGALNTDQVTNFIVKVRIDATSYADLQRDGQRYPFRPGMSAAVDIYTHTADSTLTVPLIAVTAREKEEKKGKKGAKAKEVSQKEEDDEIREVVFVVSNDTVGMREVKTGIQDNDYIQITSGLDEGEKVVTGPYSAIARKLDAGDRIVVKEEDEDEDEKDDN